MDVCLEILKEQINNLKENYYCFIGACNNMMEFSNYTVMDERLKNKENIVELKQVNEKLKFLYQQMLKVKEDISDL